MSNDIGKCAFCGEPFADRDDIDRDSEEEQDNHGVLYRTREKGHVIPQSQVSDDDCDHPANWVDICMECNRGRKNGQFQMTPIEYWAYQQWNMEDDEVSETIFDRGRWSLQERQEFLLRAAYWEARARWHLSEHHGIEAVFEPVEKSRFPLT